MRVPPLVLASASPRRRLLLEQMGLRFEVVTADIDEARQADESAGMQVRRLALWKARAVAERRPDALVVAGDTMVVLRDQTLGKPADAAAAVEMLLRLQGREHRVETGVAVVTPEGREAVDMAGADVLFRSFDRRLAEAYVATGEPLDKAGAYGIQGQGGVLVESIRGDYFAVMGLPIARLTRLLGEVGWVYGFGGSLRPSMGD